MTRHLPSHLLLLLPLLLLTAAAAAVARAQQQQATADYDESPPRPRLVAYVGVALGSPCELAPRPLLTGERPPSYCRPGLVCAPGGGGLLTPTTKGACAKAERGALFLPPDQQWPSALLPRPCVAYTLASAAQGLAPLFHASSGSGATAASATATNVSFVGDAARFGGALRCTTSPPPPGDGGSSSSGSSAGGGRVDLSPAGAAQWGGYGAVALFLRVGGLGALAAPPPADEGAPLSAYAFHHSAADGGGSDGSNNTPSIREVAIGLVPRPGGASGSPAAPLNVRAVFRRGRQRVALDSDGAADDGAAVARGQSPLDLRDGEWRFVVATLGEEEEEEEGADGQEGASSSSSTAPRPYRFRLYVDGELRAAAVVPPPPPPSSSQQAAADPGSSSSPLADAPITLCAPAQPPQQQQEDREPPSPPPSPPTTAPRPSPPYYLANAALYAKELSAGEVGALHAAWQRAAVSSAAGLGPEAVGRRGGRGAAPSSSSSSSPATDDVPAGGVPIFSPRRPAAGAIGGSGTAGPEALPAPPPGAPTAASGHVCLLPSVVAVGPSSSSSSSSFLPSSSSSILVHYGCVALPADARPSDAPMGARAFCVTAEALALGGDGGGWEPCDDGNGGGSGSSSSSSSSSSPRRRRRRRLQQPTRAGDPQPTTTRRLVPSPPLLVPLAPGQPPPRLTVGGRACAASVAWRQGATQSGGGGNITTATPPASFDDACVVAPGAPVARCAVAGAAKEAADPPVGECAPPLELPPAASPCASAARALGLGGGGGGGGGVDAGGLTFGRCVAQLGVAFCLEEQQQQQQAATGGGGGGAEDGTLEQWWRCPPLPSPPASSPSPRSPAPAAATRYGVVPAAPPASRPPRLLPCRPPGGCVLNAPLGRFQCVPGGGGTAAGDDRQPPRARGALTCAPALRMALVPGAVPLPAGRNGSSSSSSSSSADAPPNLPAAAAPCAVPFFYRGALRDDCVGVGGGLEACPLVTGDQAGAAAAGGVGRPYSPSAPWGVCVPPRAPPGGAAASRPPPELAQAAAALNATYTAAASACALPFLATTRAASLGNSETGGGGGGGAGGDGGQQHGYFRARLAFGCVPGYAGDNVTIDAGVCPSAAHAGAWLPCAGSPEPSAAAAPPAAAPANNSTIPGGRPCAVPYASGQGSGAPPGSGADLGPPTLVWGGACVATANGDAGACRVASGAWRRCVAGGRVGARTGAPCRFPFAWVGIADPGATDCVRLDGRGDGEGVCHVGGGVFEPCAAPLGGSAGTAAASPSPWSSELLAGGVGGGGGGPVVGEEERARRDGGLDGGALAAGMVLGVALPVLVALAVGVGFALKAAAARGPLAPSAAAAAAPPPPTLSDDPRHPPVVPPPAPPPPPPQGDEEQASATSTAARFAQELAAARARLFSSRAGILLTPQQQRPRDGGGSPPRSPAAAAAAAGGEEGSVLSPLSTPSAHVSLVGEASPPDRASA
jgi:hypothetical protein